MGRRHVQRVFSKAVPCWIIGLSVGLPINCTFPDLHTYMYSWLVDVVDICLARYSFGPPDAHPAHPHLGGGIIMYPKSYMYFTI